MSTQCQAIIHDTILGHSSEYSHVISVTYPDVLCTEVAKFIYLAATYVSGHQPCELVAGAYEELLKCASEQL